MGMMNDAVLSYLEDDERFADLFNNVYFGGEQIVKPQELREASEVYPSLPDRKGRRDGQKIRDIKRWLESGACLKILAVEAQNDICYLMPWRIMDYDCREYGKQIRKAQRRNQKAQKEGKKDIYRNAGERLERFRQGDRLAPVYTLCLYHGEEKWDGPRSLRDMMDFGVDGERQKWEDFFADYPMRIVCANELMDCGGFRTSLRELFALLPFRKDRAGLEKLLEENPAYQSMDEETARTISVLMGIRKFMEQEEKYRNGEDYDMCQAIREMMEDSRKEGWGEGRKEGKKEGRREGRRKEQAEGIRIFIQSNRDDGITDEAIAEKLQKYYLLSKDRARKALKKR